MYPARGVMCHAVGAQIGAVFATVAAVLTLRGAALIAIIDAISGAPPPLPAPPQRKYKYAFANVSFIQRDVIDGRRRREGDAADLGAAGIVALTNAYLYCIVLCPPARAVRAQKGAVVHT